MWNAEIFISFGSGYKSDTVSFYVNNHLVLNKEVLSSEEENNDNTNSYLRIRGDSLSYFEDRKLKFTILVKTIFEDKVIIAPIINNLPYSFTMYFKNGKYLMINKHLHYYNVYFNQYKKKPELY